MLETWRRFGWAFPGLSSSPPLPAPPPDDPGTLSDWGSDVTGAKASSLKMSEEKRDETKETEGEMEQKNKSKDEGSMNVMRQI